MWRAGASAHLNLECHVGEAWVTLQAKLGHPPAGPQPAYKSPSYHRRQAQRRISRAVKAAKATEQSSTAEQAADDFNFNEKDKVTEEMTTKADVELEKANDKQAI